MSPPQPPVATADQDSSHTSSSDDEKRGPFVVGQEPGDAAESEAPSGARTITGPKWLLVLLAILSTQFLFAALDNTIVANFQPVIVAEFDAVSKLSWISVAFLIGAAGTNLVWGKVYDQFNSKWTYILCIVLFCASAVLFILPALQQTCTILTTATRRVFPVEFFRSRTMLVLFGAMASGGTAIFLPVYFIPLFFQFTRGDSALESGVRLLPFIMLMTFAVIMSGALLSRFGFYMPWYLAGGALVVIGGALMFTVNGTTPVANVYGYTIFIGFGVGLFAQASFAVAQAVTIPSMTGSAIGFISCAQITGITLSLAIANALFLNKAQDGIRNSCPISRSTRFSK